METSNGVQDVVEFDMTTVHSAHSDESKVEAQLKKTNKALSVEESKIDMFRKMIAKGTATNDVLSFVKNQATNKRAGPSTHRKFIKTAMRSKLNDACAYVVRLRRTRRHLIKQLSYTMRDRPRRVFSERIRGMKEKSKTVKRKETERNNKKLSHLLNKYKNITHTGSQNERNLQIPPDVNELLSGVNVFKEQLSPEPPRGPMICSKSIKLNKDELAFLAKGPRYMLRNGFSKEDFLIEIEKAITKQKIGELSQQETDGQEEVAPPHRNG